MQAIEYGQHLFTCLHTNALDYWSKQTECLSGQGGIQTSSSGPAFVKCLCGPVVSTRAQDKVHGMLARGWKSMQVPYSDIFWWTVSTFTTQRWPHLLRTGTDGTVPYYSRLLSSSGVVVSSLDFYWTVSVPWTFSDKPSPHKGGHICSEQGLTALSHTIPDYWAVLVWLLTPLTFTRLCFSPLAVFTYGGYFLHSERRWQWIHEVYRANFKGILERL